MDFCANQVIIFASFCRVWCKKLVISLGGARRILPWESDYDSIGIQRYAEGFRDAAEEIETAR